MLVDSHCHLDFPDYAGNVEAVVTRAREAGVGVCVSIGTELSRFPGVRAVAEKFPDVWCSVGVHPHEAEKEHLPDPASLLAEAGHPKVVAIGETGLDYYYEHSPRAAQAENFRAHIAAGRQAKLPVIVHTRDADDDTIVAVLEDEMAEGGLHRSDPLLHRNPAPGRRGPEAWALYFGFRYRDLQELCCLARGYQKRAAGQAAGGNPRRAPYLAPVPHRGKTNEPAFVVHTARMLAELKGVSETQLAAATTDNFFRLFTKVARPPAREGAQTNES